MKRFLLGISIVTCLFLAGCSQSKPPGPPVINDMSQAKYHLINQDSAAVTFTQDLKGKYTVLGFIYTHCQYMCRLITANMAKIQQKLDQASKVQFVEITFDPERDTPERLRHYMKSYKLDPTNFQILTGDSLTIAKVLDQMHVKYFINRRDTTKAGVPQYFFKHTNRIVILDKKGRVRYKYPGSVVPAQKVIHDLRKLQSINSES